ncbi:MAG: response regulator [Anaerolineales bacterium]|jgi:CheY-like chemotaxis protein/class 3 adenylate cyclase
MARVEGSSGHILVVDDNKINLMMLTRALSSQGYQVTNAMNGTDALEILYSTIAETIDVVLLDILMPDLDGYQVLEKIKEKEELRHIPVIMISALDEMDSVIRCIEMGATDYLHKPYNPALLAARLNASLAEKRLRDLELEYLEQVGRVVEAAESVEDSTYDPDSLISVANREDALGKLARVFQSMANEIHLREQRLKQQLEQLRIDVEDMKKSMSEPLHVYIPMDRRQAMVHGVELPESNQGTAIFVDISGFTPLSETLAEQLGRKRGAEELTRILNQVYNALIEEVHRFHGAVVGFSGDAITCFLEDDSGLNAVACSVAMQEAMNQFSSISSPTSDSFSLGVKIAIVAGPVRRFLVGDPQIQNIEVLAGRTLDLLAIGEHLAERGEILVHEAIVNQFNTSIETNDQRKDQGTGETFFVLSALLEPVAAQPWIELRKDVLTEEQCRPWLLPAVYEQARSGAKAYLAEFRQAAALFLNFTGIDYDADPQAGDKLDSFTRWVQSVIAQYDGSLIQLTMGDKGSYLYATFGAPISHNDDAIRAVYAALSLQEIPAEFDWISGIKIGVTHGEMRTGSYGSTTRRTYGAQGDVVNLAARLMQTADQGILCDQSIYLATQARLGFEALEPVTVKGVQEPVEMYRPTGEKIRLSRKRVPLIGRSRERIILGNHLQEIKYGPSKVLMIEGEAGTGKTRLVEKIENYADDLGIQYFRSIPENGDGGQEYLPWRDIFWQLFHLDSLKSEPEREVKLASVIDGTLDPEVQKSVIEIILSPSQTNHHHQKSDHQFDYASQISGTLSNLLKIGFDKSPAVLIFDNAQLLDHASWELIQTTSLEIGNLLIVLALRPLTEPLAPAYNQLMRAPNLTKLGIKGLLPEEAYLFACEHLGVVSLPAELVEILEKADGNPQFIEEMVYILRDDGYIRIEGGECQVLPHVDLNSIVFPTTPEGLIKSRLDRLSPSEQMTLKIASVIGKDFTLDLLMELYPLNSDKPYIINHLETFANLDLVSASANDHSFSFQDENTYRAVYSSMLFSQRRQLHRQLAEWIEERNADSLPEYYALLADHWRKADDTAKAIDYLEKAGQRASEQGDYETAEYYFRETLKLDASSAVLSAEFFEKKFKSENIQTLKQ